MTALTEPLSDALPLSAPDAEAVGRILAVRPRWSGLGTARECLGLGPRELLHAGPPLADPRQPCVPILNSAVAAILFEGWAADAEAARGLVREGAVVLRPAQDAAAVVPLADVLSPSMWVQLVQDDAGVGQRIGSPLNGGMEHPQRVGQLHDGVVRQLRWLHEVLGPALQAALGDGVALIDLADQGLAGADDLHSRTPVATKALAARLDGGWVGAGAEAARAFIERSPGFFLNLWMASCACMLSAARGVKGSSVITAAAGNGQHFGLQLAGVPGHWWTHAAVPPSVSGSYDDDPQERLGAIGDSAIVDFTGFGAMSAPQGVTLPGPGYAPIWPDETDAPQRILAARHPAFSRTRPRVVVPAAATLEQHRAPIVVLGVLDRAGVRGRVGGGFYRTPPPLLRAAMQGLGEVS